MNRRTMIIRFGTLIGAASGAIGGTVFKLPKGSPVATHKARPPATSSADQVNHQRLLQRCVIEWRSLTAQQRTAWRTFARSVTWTNRLGIGTHPTGAQLFAYYRMPQYATPIALNGNVPLANGRWEDRLWSFTLTTAPTCAASFTPAISAVNLYRHVEVARPMTSYVPAHFGNWRVLCTKMDLDGVLSLTAEWSAKYTAPRLGEVVAFRYFNFDQGGLRSATRQSVVTVTA